MTAQLDLWSPGSRPTRARRDDPESSHRAADQAERSGRIGRQLEAALAAVRERPGLTSLELAEATGIDRYTLARRLPELARRGLVHRDERPDGIRWWPRGGEA